MPWTVTVMLDDSGQSGQATAVWNAGEPTEYTFTRRVQISPEGLSAFVAAARVALESARTKRDNELTAATTLAVSLNGVSASP